MINLIFKTTANMIEFFFINLNILSRRDSKPCYELDLEKTAN